ncbi:MAG: carboxypeptidase-like regulatory domain-containing protein [Candidatus Aenigmarchaeota archaeon]|nr:carboxypeptidase-like regulatory domain-containing protein [Candidatus Aenigmarchaeota archaeon]
MKKLLLFILIIAISSFYSVEAIPVISNIKIEPSNPWFNQDVFVSCDCSDENYTISYVYVDINGPNITISEWNLNKVNGSYSDTIDHSYLYRTGQYVVTFYCVNNASETVTGTGTFTVSNLTSTITSIIPSPAYIGDVIEINVFVKKDGMNLNSGVGFNVYLNGEKKNLKQDPPIYDSVKGWVLRIDVPSTTGTFGVDVNAEYKGAKVVSSSTIEVKQPLEFDLVSIDKTWVKPGDNVTFTFKAMFKGNAIDLRDEYLNFLINSVDSNILEIYRSGEYSYVKISVPNLLPGSYDLNIRFTYMDFVKDISRKINYVVPISGSMIDSSNKPVHMQLKFMGNEAQTTIITDSSGSYSGSIPPGIYDVELTFSNSKLTLTRVMINEFKNPIRYDRPTLEINMPGIGVEGIYVYEIALAYSNAYLELMYDDSKILDETRMIIYKCENWNFGRKLCNSDWKIISGEIDTVRNIVKINTTKLSAFMVGYKKDMFLDFDADRDEYFLKDIIRISGITQDEDSNPISDVQITAIILNTGITATTKSDKSGVFSLEFLSPDKEGDFTVMVKAEKSPFTSVNKSSSIKVFRSEKISILIPKSFRINKGESSSMSVSIINIGQRDFSRLTLSLSGIPDSYYSMPSEIEELKAGEEKNIYIDFQIPENAGISSHTCGFKVIYGNNSLEEQFVLTVSSPEINEIETTSAIEGFKFPNFTGKIVLPNLGLDSLSIMLIAVLVFSLSVLFKRRKFKKTFERREIKNKLLDIRGEIERRSMRREIESGIKRKMKKLKKRK